MGTIGPIPVPADIHPVCVKFTHDRFPFLPRWLRRLLHCPVDFISDPRHAGRQASRRALQPA